MKTQINACKLGLALGITWSLAMFVLGLAAWLLSWGNELVRVFASLYVGYAPSLIGSIIGGIWAFFDGFIGGFIVAWIYNKLNKCNHCCKQEL